MPTDVKPSISRLVNCKCRANAQQDWHAATQILTV